MNKHIHGKEMKEAVHVAGSILSTTPIWIRTCIRSAPPRPPRKPRIWPKPQVLPMEDHYLAAPATALLAQLPIELEASCERWGKSKVQGASSGQWDWRIKSKERLDLKPYLRTGRLFMIGRRHGRAIDLRVEMPFGCYVSVIGFCFMYNCTWIFFQKVLFINR